MRFSDRFNELIEMEVELAEIPIQDKLGKDVTVNVKMYDKFDSKGMFYTDSNGLEMQERKINYNPRFEWPDKEREKVPGNFYPVTSAIAMRDPTKKI